MSFFSIQLKYISSSKKKQQKKNNKHSRFPLNSTVNPVTLFCQLNIMSLRVTEAKLYLSDVVSELFGIYVLHTLCVCLDKCGSG